MTPYFSVVIPTKNRPARVHDAVKSVLRQTMGDLEVVVCDNSDDGDSPATREAVLSFGDARVRYVRTSGRLSMPDNWEHAVGEARGELVGILTDRSVYRRDALDVVAREIEQTGTEFLAWYNDLFGRYETGTEFKRRNCTLKRHRFDKDTVLGYFLSGHPKYARKIMPKLMTGMCRRSVLDDIRASGAGRVCLPVAPDYTSGFLMLAHTDSVLILDECLYVSVGTGNGADFRKRGELSERFRQDLGMTWSEMVDRMPSEACFAHALVQNDLMRVRDLVPERLPNLEVNRIQYYVGCLEDYVKTSKHGVLRTEDLHILLRALRDEPEEVQLPVQATRSYELAVDPRPVEKKKSKERTAGGMVTSGFGSVFEAMEWDEANPRVPTAESFLDTLPGIDQVKKAKTTKSALAPPPSALQLDGV